VRHGFVDDGKERGIALVLEYDHLPRHADDGRASSLRPPLAAIKNYPERHRDLPMQRPPPSFPRDPTSRHEVTSTHPAADRRQPEGLRLIWA
jgi:hypothetical protein